MRILRKILSITTAMICSVCAFAGTQTLNVNATTYENLTYSKVDSDGDGTYDYIEITDCDESATEVEIPEKIDGLSVSSIGNHAFEYCKSLTSVEIPYSIKSIGTYAFHSCQSLTSIDIPNSVTSIGTYAFGACYNLTSINLPVGITSIENYMFYDCDHLTSINIPDRVTSIGDLAFYYCIKLTSIAIPKNVTSIGEQSFLKCYGLNSITIYNPECEIYDSDYTIPGSAAICGYESSNAQTYAEKYDKTFIILGDANIDGKITALDAATIAKALAQSSISGETVTIDNYPSADYNGDYKVSASDASAIAKYLAEQALQK